MSDSNYEDNRFKGWISIFRSLQDHWIYPSDREFTEFEAWIDLLLEANHKTRDVRVKNKVLRCSRGQSVRSLTKWAERWKWSKSKTYRYFDLLQSAGMIETVSETVTTRITICNYDSYQTPPEKNETQTEQPRNDPETTLKRFGTESDSNNNVNNVKNDNHSKKRESFTPPALEEVKDYFIERGSITIEAEKFHNHFNSNGWKVSGRSPMKDWKAASRNWILRSNEFNQQSKNKTNGRKEIDVSSIGDDTQWLLDNS